jgi:hypothetical protein
MERSDLRRRAPFWLCMTLTLLGWSEKPVAAQTSPEQSVPDAPRRMRVADSDGHVSIAREYGPPNAQLALMPDGQIVQVNQQVITDEPFKPASFEALRAQLSLGPYRGFRVKQTEHYLVFYQCSPRFAESSAKLLESLYRGLVDRFQKLKFDVHETEFPLIAVIYANEDDFRARRAVDRDIQAYYELMSNRVFFFEQATSSREDPMIEAMRRPQTVAHEGTHQILNNIGIQPRLAEWPPWLVEGLAELAASSSETSRDGEWVGFSKVNQLHVATLDDLEDDLAQRNGRTERAGVGIEWGRSMVEYIITREQLSPTDYALAWTLTHFLANKKRDNFIAYMKEMSARVPGRKLGSTSELELFQKHFGEELLVADAPVRRHIAKLRRESSLTYYAVLFQQALPGNLARRGTLVSRSPQVIREWVEQRMPDPRGGTYQWQAVPFRSKQQAFLYTEQWLATEP